jgi:hypothetical protein
MNTRSRVPGMAEVEIEDAERPRPQEFAQSQGGAVAVRGPTLEEMQKAHERTARTAHEAASAKAEVERITNLPETGFGQITGAIANVMAEIAPVLKEGKNSHFGYSYDRIEDLLQAVTPLMGKYGLVVLQTEHNIAFREDQGNKQNVAVTYDFRVLHSSGECLPNKMLPQPLRATGLALAVDTKGNFDDKCINKAHTAARKFFLKGLIQIPTDSPNDADSGQGGGANRGGARAPAPGPSTQGHVPPYTIDTKDITVHAFGEKYLAHIANARTVAELEMWDKMNDHALSVTESKNKDFYNKLMDTFDAKVAALKNEEAARQPERNEPDPKMVAAQRDPLPVDPEDVIKWAEGLLSAIGTDDEERSDKLEAASAAIHREITAKNLIAPDAEAVRGIVRKHERRLS